MYYILEENDLIEPGPYSAVYDGESSALEPIDFISGNVLDLKLDEPVVIRLYEYTEGDTGMADFYSLPFPIMSDTMFRTLTMLGVSNLQTWPATLLVPNQNECIDTYKIVNIIGTIAAADMTRSDYIDMGGSGRIAVGFRNLVIDEQKADGAKMFRLAESPSTIIIHEDIKAGLEDCCLKYLRFIPCIEIDMDEEFNIDDYNWDD
ncbi:MAG: hypothetical protein OEZ39_09285 [Gammaproteobacteria bacterium]|nr:hypothetical protein [Gammaproteobacteria bacterium]MDH5652037.1 hypothetical protein [Gammaproteobacteria bacterium]